MLIKYKLRYAIICAFLTCTIFASACIFSFRLTQNTLTNDANLVFDTQCAALESLLSSNQIDITRFYNLQKSSGINVNFYENNQLIELLSPSVENQHNLIQNFIQILSTNDIAVFSKPSEYSSFVLDATVENHNSYHLKWVAYPVKTNVNHTILFFSSRLSQLQAIEAIMQKYVFGFVVGVIIIILLSTILAHFSVKPLEQSIKSQREFIAMASHELKTPLSVISSSVQMIDIDKANPKHYLQIIASEIDRMSRLILDLLLITNINAQGLQYYKESIDIELILFSLYEKFIPIAHNHNQTLHIKTSDSDIPLVMADIVRIEQAISALICNAIEHNADGITITISLHRERHKTIIKIIDNGVGMNDTDKKMAFNKFYKSETPKSTKKHFGLGLAIAKEILQAHGMTLILSDTPNGGLTASVIIPHKKV